MYLLRPALRASHGRAPARFIHRRRYPSSARARSFHSTRCLAQTPNPPPSPDNTPIDENGVDKRSREKVVAEQPDAGVATEDPEILAQKLQRSREMTRRYSSALRRTQRRNRAQDLPPVHIPDWFLKRRVIRYKDLPEHVRNSKTSFFSPILTHAGSGEHGMCSIPVPSYSKGVDTLSRLVRAMWKTGLQEDQIKNLARQFAKSMGLDQNEDVVKALERGQDPAMDPRAAPLNFQDEAKTHERQKLEQLQELKTADMQKLNDSGIPNGETERRALQDLERRKKVLDRGTDIRVAPLVRAEIRATIAAALSALQPVISNSFPSAKTNLLLHSPVPGQDHLMQRSVLEAAHEVGSDVVILQAQDLAQIAGDYLGEGPEPSPHSIRSLGYETYKLSSEPSGASIFDELGHDDTLEDDQDTSSPPFDPLRPDFSNTPSPFPPAMVKLPILAISPALSSLKSLTQGLKVMQLPSTTQASSSDEQQSRPQTQNEIQLEELKISTLLEALIDATELKQSRGLSDAEQQGRLRSSSPSVNPNQEIPPKFFDYSMGNESAELAFDSALPFKSRPDFRFSLHVGPTTRSPRVPRNSKIVLIRDFKELNATQYGGRIIQKLEEIVRKRRGSGESIMIVGLTSSSELTPDLSSDGVQFLQSEDEGGFYRTVFIVTDPRSYEELHDYSSVQDEPKFRVEERITPAEKRKFRNINLTHIQDMLRCLDPVVSVKVASREPSPELRAIAPLFPESYCWKVMPFDEVHRISLTALGLHITDPSSAHLSWAHVALAMGLLNASDQVKYAYVRQMSDKKSHRSLRKEKEREQKIKERMASEDRFGATASQRQRDLERVAASASKHEKRLMPGIANPDQIKTTFDQVHVPKETVDSIRTLTSLSLLRPDAFNYGVLATEKISGALLYGPPGTGKTLLAKAVAKESGSTVLEVSGSQIMDKYVGEGEKNVAAIFSLARKLSPCVVFLDEADAIFASRDAARERTSHRDILNQFLKEWDGLNDLSVFVMVATNRPFDLDDAVIRRLPRRILVDLPIQADRKEILKIHLRGEQMDEAVDLEDLAKRTPFYSGSDLKNLVVSAALACVKEENEQAVIAAAKALSNTTGSEPQDTSADGSLSPKSPFESQLVPGQQYTFPEKRVLHARHFDKALQEISASISEDMSSLNAIKKFDEQYGDKKGKKKKNPYGFGINADSNENAARVRT